jgi:aquaporin Z
VDHAARRLAKAVPLTRERFSGENSVVEKPAANISTNGKERQSAHQQELDAITSLRLHWPEYVMELAEMGLYLLSTCIFATLLQHPASPIRHLLPNGIVRRACFGISVGTTIVAIVLTPWGKRSGGHLNPAMTFTFYRLGKVEFWDAIFYGVTQFAGGAVGVFIATTLLLGAPRNPAIRYAATLPGMYGAGVAFIAEAGISFVLMLTVLFASNHNVLSRYTPFFVGALYAIFITLETPLSGMSMNPARTFGSAFLGRYWHTLWIYFLAPTLGMLAAAELFLWVRSGVGPYCAKLHHHNDKRCIFRHGPQEKRGVDTASND